MMDMYESQMTRAVPDRVAVGGGSLGLGRGGGCDQEGGAQLVRRAGRSSELKRKTRLFDEADQTHCRWSHPLQLLVRKGLSVSDVSDLGRIILPKRCAESNFQHIDTKEGALLQMEDYSGSRLWFFRFKWWTNNKSRMYVLENTGEFIKYHGLKEHDIFVVYADCSNKLVVRGHKGTDLDATLEKFQEISAGSSPPTTSSRAFA